MTSSNPDGASVRASSAISAKVGGTTTMRGRGMGELNAELAIGAGVGRWRNTTAREARPEPGFTVPTTVRAANTAFAKALAEEVAPFGIQANVVAPNYV